MSDASDFSSVQFTPRRPASRPALIVGVIVGPLAWLVALAGTALIIARGWAIQVGLLVAILSFTAALIVLAVLRAARRRQAEHYANAL